MLTVPTGVNKMTKQKKIRKPKVRHLINDMEQTFIEYGISTEGDALYFESVIRDSGEFSALSARRIAKDFERIADYLEQRKK